LGEEEQCCQTNFSSVEDVQNCQNRGGLSQKIESLEDFCTLETVIFGLTSERQLIVRNPDQANPVKKPKPFKNFFSFEFFS
jgi:hypothetical protein